MDKELEQRIKEYFDEKPRKEVLMDELIKLNKLRKLLDQKEQKIVEQLKLIEQMNKYFEVKE